MVAPGIWPTHEGGPAITDEATTANDATAALSQPTNPANRLNVILCEEHGVIHHEDRPWLPKMERGDLAPHDYCPDCGEVKARGRPALDKGGIVNLIADATKKLEDAGHKVTSVQKRLIMQRIEEAGADDAYGLTKDKQLAMVAQIAGPLLGIPEAVMKTYLE